MIRSRFALPFALLVALVHLPRRPGTSSLHWYSPVEYRCPGIPRERSGKAGVLKAKRAARPYKRRHAHA